MRDKSCRFGVYEIWRQKKNSISASVLSGFGKLLRDRSAISATRNYWNSAAGFGNSCRYHCRELFESEGKEFASTASSKESRGMMIEQPCNVIAIRLLVKFQLLV